jgi:NADP-dependent 3-hydroxy acid dehydrogenase YdfG
MKMNRRPSLDGKVAIVTGASSGIGEATAREYAQAGAITVLAARRADRLKRLQEEIEEIGGTALAVPTDVTDPNQIMNLVETTIARFGRIDILANIAGWALYDWLEDLTYEQLRKTYDVNVIGLAEVCRQVIPVMQRQRSGLIINMSSYASQISTPPLTVYASTKYAVEGLTDGMRRTLRPWGITVIRVHPSSVTGTEFNDRVVREGGVRYTPLPIGRISRETLARHMVDLVENPRRALFISRLYDPLVFLNNHFPELVDWVMSRWVRSKRKKELPPAKDVAQVRYPGTHPAWMVAGSLGMLAIVFRLLAGKTSRKKPLKKAAPVGALLWDSAELLSNVLGSKPSRRSRSRKRA